MYVIHLFGSGGVSGQWTHGRDVEAVGSFKMCLEFFHRTQL